MNSNGAEGIRTLDPHVANVVLSQLSYCPSQLRDTHPLGAPNSESFRVFPLQKLCVRAGRSDRSLPTKRRGCKSR